MKKYTKDQVWFDNGRLGVTRHAVQELGEIVYVAAEKEASEGAPFGQIESVKAVSDLTAPFDMKNIKVNPALETDPSLLNRDPDTWIAEADFEEKGGMTEKEYLESL